MPQPPKRKEKNKKSEEEEDQTLILVKGLKVVAFFVTAWNYKNTALCYTQRSLKTTCTDKLNLTCTSQTDTPGRTAVVDFLIWTLLHTIFTHYFCVFITKKTFKTSLSTNLTHDCACLFLVSFSSPSTINPKSNRTPRVLPSSPEYCTNRSFEPAVVKVVVSGYSYESIQDGGLPRCCCALQLARKFLFVGNSITFHLL